MIATARAREPRRPKCQSFDHGQLGKNVVNGRHVIRASFERFVQWLRVNADS